MSQSQTRHKLFFHLVFATKNREPLFNSTGDSQLLFDLFRFKANQLETRILEFGNWREHVHQVIQAPPKYSLSTTYGQMKGFVAHTWNQKYTDRILKWQDGVFIQSLDPNNLEPVREYVRNQWERHEARQTIPLMEP